MQREPLVLAFVFAFPVVTVLVIAGAFTAEDAPDFGGVDPSRRVRLVLPGRDHRGDRTGDGAGACRGVPAARGTAPFRRSRLPPWSFAVTSIAVGVLLTLVASAVMLAVAGPLYGLPAIHSPARTLLAILVGAVTFTSIGLLIGSVVPNARAAQGIGLLAFFPSFLLGGGGPPPSVMGDGMRRVTDLLPLTHVTESIRDPWLGTGSGSGHLAIVLAILAVSAIGWSRAIRHTEL